LHLPRLAMRPADFDPATRDRLIAGALVPAAWYIQAQRFRRWFRKRVLEVFRNADVLLAPATPITAPKLGQEMMTLAGKAISIRANLGLFTQPISFIGLPVVVVPVETKATLPIGVQIIGAPWRETDVLRMACELERQGAVGAPAALRKSD
jgi:Asp-tRNA(Asn)/Glu-tRNA(Gln) amidotransferase A subunit family amidase